MNDTYLLEDNIFMLGTRCKYIRCHCVILENHPITEMNKPPIHTGCDCESINKENFKMLTRVIEDMDKNVGLDQIGTVNSMRKLNEPNILEDNDKFEMPAISSTVSGLLQLFGWGLLASLIIVFVGIGFWVSLDWFLDIFR